MILLCSHLNFLPSYFHVFSETQCSKEVRHIYTTRKPAVPARTDNPPLVMHTKRDYIKTTTLVPMKPQPTFVDTKKGHKQRLENSGLVPKYIKKKVFSYNRTHKRSLRNTTSERLSVPTVRCVHKFTAMNARKR
uniref:Uncharacterized protein n=1 Tax=Seriola lalandi dorsalis TaxID=1841481 RepID=A0A3B4WHI5_SERLL